ncbi:MAG TPA: PAS domain S-box protein, partial [Burkholderiales bacterium]|nr:PAS domain S-box protein [Burkholderiales bacterium]
NGQAGTPPRSIWYAPDREPFADFIDVSNRFTPDLQGSFYNRVLRERTAVWMEDLQTGPDFGRCETAIAHGLRSAFAFPIIARGVVAAVMEVFARETRPQDPLALGAAHSIASQLARIVEREWAYQANARMAAIVESSRDAILSRNLEGTILTWNRAAERLLGYTAEEIIGRDVRLVIPSELHEGMLDRQAMLRRGSSVPARETVRIARDGRRIDVLTSPATIRDSRGEICGISTIIRDITERKQAEQELRQAQQRLQVAVHGGGVGLWDWDLGTGVVYFSPEWKQQLGYGEHDIPDAIEEWQSRIHPDDRARVSAELEEFLVQRRSEYRSEFRLRHKDGSYRWILSRASAQLGENGNVERMFGCHVDVTDQKQAEAERLENAVRQRDALVREVHHRIKNSLQGVAGLLRQKIRKYPAIAPGIEEAIAQLQSVALVYGLQETRSDGLLSLADVTDAICSSAESLIGGRVERAFERRSQRAACVAGPEAVSVAVALNELVFNALKHHPAAAGKKLIRVALRETPAGAEIRIANRGRLPKGFDFAEGRAVGNGLGLVRTLLASPGGNIRFSSARNEVEVVVKLSAPLLTGPKQAITRRVKDEDAKERREATAYPGGGRRPAGARSIG